MNEEEERNEEEIRFADLPDNKKIKDESDHSDDENEDEEDAKAKGNQGTSQEGKAQGMARKNKRTKRRRKKGREGKSKDTVAVPPKQGRSAYSLFLFSVRKKIRDENPKISGFDFGRKVAEMWKMADQTEWEEKAVLDEQRYENEMKNYDETKGKPGMHNAYFFFLCAKREEIKEQNPGIDEIEIKKKATEMFEVLEDKSEWEKKAVLDYAEKNTNRPAYLQFLYAKREEIKKQNPALKGFEIKKKAGEMFRALKDISEWEEKAKEQEKEEKRKREEKLERKRKKQMEKHNAKKTMYEMQSTEKAEVGLMANVVKGAQKDEKQMEGEEKANLTT